MLNQKLQDALNGQIVAEMWSANLYMSMSFYFEKQGFSGFATWLKKQAAEETEHAYAFADFIIKRGGTAVVGKLDAVPTSWETPLDAFEHVYNHECTVSAAIDKLHDLASSAATRHHRTSCGSSYASRSRRRLPPRASSTASSAWATTPSSTSTSSTAHASKPTL